MAAECHLVSREGAAVFRRQGNRVLAQDVHDLTVQGPLLTLGQLGSGAAQAGRRVTRPNRNRNRGEAMLTSDPSDPRLTHGPDSEPTGQAEVYLVLSEEERAQGFVRPVRAEYRHTVCGAETRMSRAIAETYARQPYFYGATFCAACGLHRPVGADGEFEWLDGSKVGT